MGRLLLVLCLVVHAYACVWHYMYEQIPGGCLGGGGGDGGGSGCKVAMGGVLGADIKRVGDWEREQVAGGGGARRGSGTGRHGCDRGVQGRVVHQGVAPGRPASQAQGGKRVPSAISSTRMLVSWPTCATSVHQPYQALDSTAYPDASTLLPASPIPPHVKSTWFPRPAPPPAPPPVAWPWTLDECRGCSLAGQYLFAFYHSFLLLLGDRPDAAQNAERLLALAMLYTGVLLYAVVVGAWRFL